MARCVANHWVASYLGPNGGYPHSWGSSLVAVGPTFTGDSEITVLSNFTVPADGGCAQYVLVTAGEYATLREVALIHDDLVAVQTKLDTQIALQVEIKNSTATSSVVLSNDLSPLRIASESNLGAVGDLTWAVVLIFAAIGLGLGYKMFAPKRNAIVEV